MKKTTLFFTVFVFFLVSSCIPSLHSIVNKENVITDDRLVGDWRMEEDLYTNAKFNFSVEAEDEEDRQGVVKAITGLAKQLNPKDKKKFSIWKFERAMNFEAEDEQLMTHPKGHGLKVAYNPGIPSMLPKDRKWTITEKEELPFYILTYKTEKDKKRFMKVELTKIGNDFYMDFYPYYLNDDHRFAANFIHAHTFAKISFSEDKLIMHPFDIIEIEDLIKTKKVRLKHEIMGKTTVEKGEIVYSDNIVLTASTQELRAFIAKYSDNEDLFDEAEELTAYNEKNP